jgi:radical SAM protein with 4Fe4S-binding SPASM domain|tara:strand:- start:30904 stop:31812 length:909 start_codon:yes stop_codon:yes gene_type:complete
MYFPNKEITIEVTNRCGAKCIMCPREKMKQNLEVMPFDVYKKTVDDAFSCGVELIDLCGYGDVFLDRNLMEKVKYTKEINPKSKVYISTTGNAMIEKYHEQILEYVDILKLSIYGVTKEIYENVMGGIKFEKSYQNINSFLSKDKTKKVFTIGNFILMQENKHQMQEWIDYWEPKLSEVYVWKPHNYVDGRSYRKIDKNSQKTCGRPLEGPLNIAVNGKAHVCCFDYNKEMIVGDIKTQKISEILNSEEMKSIQLKHEENNFKDLICEKCDQLNKDDTVLVYKTNPERVVGQSNSSNYVFKS